MNSVIKDIIAIDIETTGLTPTTGGILEICMYKLNDKLEVEDSFGGVLPFRGIIKDKVVVNMHLTSELIISDGNQYPTYITNKPTTSLVAAYKWLNKYNNIIFLGSSVHFDKKWIEHEITPIIGKLHHRIIDTSSLTELFPCKELLSSKPTRHRAAEDTAYSIEVARHYRHLLLVGDRYNSMFQL